MKFISLFVVLSILTLNGCGSSDDPKQRLDYGIKLFEDGEFTKARLELKSAKQQDKNIPEVYYYLALINEHNKNYRSMYHNLERAIKLKPDYLEARLKLGKLLLLSGNVEKAQEQMEKILEISSTNKEGLVFKAMLLNRQGKQDEAKTIIVDLLKDDPNFAEAATLNAMLLIHEKKYDEAQKQLMPLIEDGSDHVPLYMVKILLDAKINDYDAVIKDYQQLIHHYPENDDLKYALVQIYIQTKKQQEAEQLLIDLVKQKPDELTPKLKWLELLYFYETKNGGDRVKTQLDEYFQEYKDDPDTLIAISGWMLHKNMFAQGQAVLENVDISSMKKEKQAKIKLTLAKLAFQQRDFKKANKIIDEILEIKANYWPAKILKSKILVAENDYEKAAELLNKITWANPKDDEPLSLLAQIDLIKNDPTAAEKKFLDTLRLNPANTLALQYLVNQELKKKNYDYANKLISRALVLKPKDMELLKNAAQIRLLNQDWQGVNQVISAIEQIPGGKPDAFFLQGKILQFKNQCDQAVSIFEQLLNQYPQRINALHELARCREVLKERSAFNSYLVEFTEKHPDNIAAKMMLSDLYLAEQKDKKAEQLLKSMLSVNPELPQVYVKLSRIYRSQNKYQQSIQICEKGLGYLPNNLAISLELASVYELSGQYEEAIAIYENLIQIHPKMNLIANNLAALLTDHRQDYKSQQRSLELASRFKKIKQPYFLDTYAWVLVNQGELAEAVNILQEVNRKVPNEPVFKYHLGVALHKQGNDAAAKLALKKSIELGEQSSYFAELDSAKKLYDELVQGQR